MSGLRPWLSDVLPETQPSVPDALVSDQKLLDLRVNFQSVRGCLD